MPEAFTRVLLLLLGLGLGFSSSAMLITQNGILRGAVVYRIINNSYRLMDFQKKIEAKSEISIWGGPTVWFSFDLLTPYYIFLQQLGNFFKVSIFRLLYSESDFIPPHCSKSSFFVQFNFDFPRKLSIFGVKNSWKCCGFGLFSCWQLWFHVKNCPKKFGWKRFFFFLKLNFWTIIRHFALLISIWFYPWIWTCALWSYGLGLPTADSKWAKIIV